MSTTSVPHHDGTALPPGARFRAAAHPAIGEVRSAATNEGANGMSLRAGSGAALASWTLLGAVCGAAGLAGFVLLVFTVLPFTVHGVATYMAVGAAVGLFGGALSGFGARKLVERGAWELSYVGALGVQCSSRGVSTVVPFADVARLDIQRTDLRLRGVDAAAQETLTLAWTTRAGRQVVIHCEYQPALARGTHGVDHDRWAFAVAAERAWSAYTASSPVHLPR